MKVPFDEHPYTAFARFLKTDKGVDVMKAIQKKLYGCINSCSCDARVEYNHRSEGFPNRIFHPCTLSAGGLARQQTVRVSSLPSASCGNSG